MLIHNNIIFVGPLDMVKALLELVRDSSFWASIFSSFARISLGFLGAFVLSILLGCLAYAFPLIRELLEPVMLLIKSVPVASFVILALIWIGSHNLAVFTSFLVVVPMILSLIHISLVSFDTLAAPLKLKSNLTLFCLHLQLV